MTTANTDRVEEIRDALATFDDAELEYSMPRDLTFLLAEVDRFRGESAILAARVHQVEHQLQGVCPSCRHNSLTVDDRGWVTCHWSTCEDPGAVGLLLASPDAAAVAVGLAVARYGEDDDDSGIDEGGAVEDRWDAATMPPPANRHEGGHTDATA